MIMYVTLQMYVGYIRSIQFYLTFPQCQSKLNVNLKSITDKTNINTYNLYAQKYI